MVADASVVTCEHCGEEFDGERELHDHWYRVVGDDDHALTREQRRAGLDEHTRQWKEHEVVIHADVEIPHSAWVWACDHARIDTPSDAIEDLPDPEDLQDTAMDIVDVRYHFEVVQDAEPDLGDEKSGGEGER